VRWIFAVQDAILTLYFLYRKKPNAEEQKIHPLLRGGFFVIQGEVLKLYFVYCEKAQRRRAENTSAKLESRWNKVYTCILVKSANDVHILNSLSCGTFNHIVNGGNDDYFICMRVFVK